MSTSFDSAGQPGAASSTSAAHGPGIRAPGSAPGVPYRLLELSEDLADVHVLLDVAAELLAEMEEAGEVDELPASRLDRGLRMLRQHMCRFNKLVAEGTTPDVDELFNVAVLIDAISWVASRLNQVPHLLRVASRRLEGIGDRLMDLEPPPRPPATIQPGSAS